jgi:hypothetical protein
MSREFCCKQLNLLNDWASKIDALTDFYGIPC